jgi:hypothetical protein
MNIEHRTSNTEHRTGRDANDARQTKFNVQSSISNVATVAAVCDRRPSFDVRCSALNGSHLSPLTSYLILPASALRGLTNCRESEQATPTRSGCMFESEGAPGIDAHTQAGAPSLQDGDGGHRPPLQAEKRITEDTERTERCLAKGTEGAKDATTEDSISTEEDTATALPPSLPSRTSRDSSSLCASASLR